MRSHTGIWESAYLACNKHSITVTSYYYYYYTYWYYLGETKVRKTPEDNDGQSNIPSL